MADNAEAVANVPPVPGPVHHGLEETLIGIPEALHVYFDGTGFPTAFAQSFLMIVATEIGDRTFFIAAIMAMKNSRAQVLVGALGALYVMTILSAAAGRAFPLLFDQKYTSIAAACLFLYFGALMLRDWHRKRGEVAENAELQEVENELSQSQDDVEKDDDDEDKYRTTRRKRILQSLIAPLVIKAFSLTFLAEWGDRSQVATIALAAAKNIYGVILGGMLGHTLCTCLAVIGGRLLATRISERAVLLTGGILFVFFAGLTATGHLT